MPKAASTLLVRLYSHAHRIQRRMQIKKMTRANKQTNQQTIPKDEKRKQRRISRPDDGPNLLPNQPTMSTNHVNHVSTRPDARIPPKLIAHYPHAKNLKAAGIVRLSQGSCIRWWRSRGASSVVEETRNIGQSQNRKRRIDFSRVLAFWQKYLFSSSHAPTRRVRLINPTLSSNDPRAPVDDVVPKSDILGPPDGPR